MIVLAPVLFAIGFILNLYLGNITELRPSILVTPIGAALFMGLLLSFVGAVSFRNRVKGVVFASIFVVAFFVFGDKPILGVGVILGAGIFVFQSKKDFKTVAKYLLVTSIIIVLVALGRVVLEERQKALAEIKSPLKLPAFKNVSKEDLPDIYYIVPDSYSASTSLLKYYGFDNREFEKFLEDKGFYVATAAASNYPKTFLSLGSSLNMEYLDFMSVNKASKNLSLLDSLMEDNNVVKLLKSYGYKYYHLGSWWGATHINRNADFNVILENKSAVPISQFDYIVLQSTILDPIVDQLIPKVSVGDSDRDRMNRANYQFEQLSELASQPGPKFVFAHIIAPHEPYFYDRNCQFVPLSERKKIREEVKYINHLVCVNKKLEESVNGIFKNSKKAPVILIQSDEGAPFLAEELDPNDAWGKASDAFLKEKFFVFSAYYLPLKGNSKLYSTITPVNSFRTVFNEYLGTNFSQLPDKSFIMPDLKHLYDFVDITGKIR